MLLNLTLPRILFAFILLMNLLSYLTYYLDKKRSEKRRPRISERRLLFLAFFFGGLGAWLAIHQFRHKTQKKSFKLLIPLTALWTLVSFYYVYYL